ncbi:hypothetical protein ACT7C9_01100 [Bacillus cereus]
MTIQLMKPIVTVNTMVNTNPIIRRFFYITPLAGIPGGGIYNNKWYFAFLMI